MVRQQLFHGQSEESWEYSFPIIPVELSEDLSTVIVDDFVVAANHLQSAGLASVSLAGEGRSRPS